MSEFWRFHCEYIHAVVIRDGFLFPSFFLGKEWLGKVRLHLDSIRPNRSSLHTDRPVQLSFFGHRHRIRDGYLTPFSFPNSRSGFTPSPRLLPTVTMFQQNSTNGIFAHFRQTIRALCNAAQSVFNDQVAVPSISGVGSRRNSCKIRPRSICPYFSLGPPP